LGCKAKPFERSFQVHQGNTIAFNVYTDTRLKIQSQPPSINLLS